MLKFVCFALLVSCVAAGTITTTKCGGEGAVTSIEGCSGAGPCTVVKGKNTPIQISFTPKSQVTGGKYTISATYLGVTIAITDKDLSVGVSLPIAGGSSATHTHTLTLASNLLAVTAPATLKITDQSGNVVVCETISIKIVNA